MGTNIKEDAFIDKIYKANTIEELVDIFNFLKESEFISYRVDINKMKDDDFIQLSIDDAEYDNDANGR